MVRRLAYQKHVMGSSADDSFESCKKYLALLAFSLCLLINACGWTSLAFILNQYREVSKT